jgi:hypothetical protein
MKKIVYIVIALIVLAGLAFAFSQSSLFKGKIYNVANNGDLDDRDVDDVIIDDGFGGILDDGTDGIDAPEYDANPGESSCVDLELSPDAYEVEYDTPAEDIEIAVIINNQDPSWSGTLVLESTTLQGATGAGLFMSGNTGPINPLRIDDLHGSPVSITGTYTGGAADDLITAYIEDEDGLCSDFFPITEAEPTDVDGDGIYANEDLCPEIPATGYDLDGDGCIDDTDGDDIKDNVDECDEEHATPEQDLDRDGCIDDTDGDGLPDNVDECKDDAPAPDADADGNGCTDPVIDPVVDPDPVDTDGDGLPDDIDECKDDAPAPDADADGNGCTDPVVDPVVDPAVDPDPVDTDGDGLTDDIDECKDDAPAPDADADGNGCTDPVIDPAVDPDPVDTDTDGDGFTDDEEITYGTDPLDATSYPAINPVDPVDPVVEGCTHPFRDVENGYWGEPYICDAYEETIVNGKSSTIFDPDASVTKAEFLKMALRVAGYSSTDATGSEDFTDVSSSDWYYPWVRIAEQLDILKITDSFFNSNLPITRGDATVMLVRIAGETLYGWNDSEVPFYDVSTSDAFAYAVLIAYNAGVIEGYPDDSFRPYNYIQRDEAAAIVLRAKDAWFQ